MAIEMWVVFGSLKGSYALYKTFSRLPGSPQLAGTCLHGGVMEFIGMTITFGVKGMPMLN
jgi:hypothetical protein